MRDIDKLDILAQDNSGFPLTFGYWNQVFSRIFKVNNSMFEGYILRNSLIYIPLRKSGPLTKLWKGHINFKKAGLISN